MLKSLALHGVGPVHGLTASLGERLNVLTGDNGLGKSFLLDVSFWALTGTWPGGRVAIPESRRARPRIEFEVKSKAKSVQRKAEYDFKTQTWSRQAGRPPMPGLVVYAAVDGGFAVWDPARNYWRDPPTGAAFIKDRPDAYQFTPKEVAEGLPGNGGQLCNGLIQDWVSWYYQRASRPNASPFDYLEGVVDLLSHPSEPLRAEEPRKVFVDDSRKFPTLGLPYGVLPYPLWSAAIKRIVSFAYLIVWAWTEHLQAAELRKESPADRLILIVDEIEAHLHPKWQRTILPAVLNVVEKLRADIGVQIIAATHSPLVLASLEPYFDDSIDQFFCFSLTDDKVSFDNVPWAVHGDVLAWLASDVFGLEQARSREAERVIEAAEAFMRGDPPGESDGLRTKEQITEELRRILPGLDPFWPRWIVKTQS